MRALLPYASFVAFFSASDRRPDRGGRARSCRNCWRLILRSPRAEHIAEGLTIFLLGLAKKLVLADTFANFSDVGFAAAAHGAPLSFVEAWYAARVLRAADLLRTSPAIPTWRSAWRA